MRMRYLFASALVLALFVGVVQGVSGAPGSKSAEDPIVIGAAIGVTGILAPYDVPPYQGIKLVAEKINKSGGLLGRQIKFVLRDMRSKLNEAPRAAQTVIDRGADLLLVPCDPDFAAPGGTVGQARGVVTISLCQASPRWGVQSIGPLAYTPSHTVYLEGYVMAEWAALQKKWKRAFVVREKSWSYTKDACTGFQNRWNELAGSKGTVGQDDVAYDDTSIAATITRIKSAKPQPQFIWLCSQTPEAAGWIRQMRAAGLNQPILSDMAMDGDYWLGAVKRLSDFYYPAAGSIFGDDPSTAINAFVKSFTKSTKEKPETSYALFGPALMQIYVTAVKRAGSTDAQAVAKALDGFKNVPTLVGQTTYTPQVHIVLNRPMRIMQVQKGKMGFLQVWKVRKPPKLNG